MANKTAESLAALENLLDKCSARSLRKAIAKAIFKLASKTPQDPDQIYRLELVHDFFDQIEE